jgi:outer membrane lipoprotein-sorting protein
MPTNRIAATLAVALVLPLAAVAVGQAPGPAPSPPPAGPEAPKADAPPTEAEAAIDAAIAKLEAVPSMAANIKQDVKLLGLKYQVVGQYLRAPDYRIRLRLDIQGLGDVTGTMQQVCDGRVFWEVRKVLDATDIYKREMQPILQQLARPECDDELRTQVLSTLGFSGPDALLAGLRGAIGFDQKEEAELDGRKVWIVRGQWKDRARLTSPNQPPLPPIGPLPPYIPSLAEVWIDQETGWPHRVKLTGKAPSLLESKKDMREVGPDGKPIGRPIAAPKVDPSEIVLAYTEVQVSPTIDPLEFSFTPPQGAQVIDQTQAIATDLTNALAERAARKKAEAAREGGLELPAPIAVPRPPADAVPANQPATESTVPAPATTPAPAPTNPGGGL